MKPFKQWITEAVTGNRSTPEYHASKICDEYVSGNLTIPNQLLNSRLGGKLSHLEYLPDNTPRHITGYFNCGNNHLRTLHNSPEIVDTDFYCHANWLTSLEGGPRVVKGDFDCRHNEIQSLDGCPEYIGGRFRADKFDHKDYLEFIERRKYAQQVLHGTSDEAGLGDILGVL